VAVIVNAFVDLLESRAADIPVQVKAPNRLWLSVSLSHIRTSRIKFHDAFISLTV